MTFVRNVSRMNWVNRAAARFRGRVRSMQLSPIQILVGIVVLWLASNTDGLFTPQSLLSLVSSASLVGCVAVGMSFVTFSGYIMSFALGATVGVSAIICAALSDYGLMTAIVGALTFGIAFNSIQGFVIGYFRANSLIVTIAAASLAGGASEYLTTGQTVYVTNAALEPLRAKPFGLPLAALVVLACLAMSHVVFSRTRLGRRMFMVGSNPRAAQVVGVQTFGVTTWAFGIAGLFAACTGVLIAGRYGAGMFDYGADYDYRAIAAVLVGGNSVAGGEGSVWRTALGVVLIALISAVLLLRGYSSEIQLFVGGFVVLLAILLQGRRKR